MQISVLALEGFWDTGLAVTLDALTAANKLSAALLNGRAHFDVSVNGIRKKVRSGQGLTIPVRPITRDIKPDWVIVPALTPTAQILQTLERPDVRLATTQLAEWHTQGTRIGASCVGTFLVAEAGLLDGCEATTNWASSPLFRQRYPRVMLDESRIIVPSEIGVTAGAAMGHLDLALWLVRSVSPELADIVARYLVADARSSQSPYVIPAHLAKADPLILRFEQWARGHLSAGFSLQNAADALATSARTLQRRCTAVLGKSPHAYFQDLRVEHARSLIQSSDLDVESIAAEVGYEDGATLRSLLRQRLGQGVRELRTALR
jgi:transcriptional regulator GlxA family with amidase domain